MLSERAERFRTITVETLLETDFDLLKVCPIDTIGRGKIVSATKIFLWSCLSRYFPDKDFDLGVDPLAEYAGDIERLPNITPNGLVLPKEENQLSYNILHSVVADEFRKLNLTHRIDRIQFPINVRLQSGRIDLGRDARPRASTKPHSDIWAGDPAAGLMVFLAVLGDPEKVGIDFFDPPEYPEEFLRPLADYNEGRPLVEAARKLSCRFHENGWFLVDPFLVHQTIKSGSGLRLSLDFRFIPRLRVSSDRDEAPSRRRYFIPISQWNDLGRNALFLTNEPLKSFQGVDASTEGYPVALDVVPVRKSAS